MSRHVLIRGDASDAPTLGELMARLEELKAAGIPEDTKASGWYNPNYLREEIVFEIPVDPKTLSASDLIYAFTMAPLGALERQAAWDEIVDRLKAFGRAGDDS